MPYQLGIRRVFHAWQTIRRIRTIAVVENPGVPERNFLGKPFLLHQPSRPWNASVGGKTCMVNRSTGAESVGSANDPERTIAEYDSDSLPIRPHRAHHPNCLETAFNIIVGRDKKRHGHGDPTREVFETVVFVVVLVLMLKLVRGRGVCHPHWLDGEHALGRSGQSRMPGVRADVPGVPPQSAGARGPCRRDVSCQNCGRDLQPEKRQRLDTAATASWSPSTTYHIPIAATLGRSGLPISGISLFRIRTRRAMNYIKRLVGLPGETIAIYKGDLYRTTDAEISQIKPSRSARGSLADPLADTYSTRPPRRIRHADVPGQAST